MLTRAGEVLHRSGWWLAALVFPLLGANALAAPYCTRPQDAMAVLTAAVQQEMMVAAFMCHDVAAYNHFVLSHRPELQDSDKALMDFFTQASAQTGFDDYNLFKTELANASSLRSVSDRQFCRRANSDFEVALGRDESLAQVLSELPYSVETGSVRCPSYRYQTTFTTSTSTRARTRHRTWLGRQIDAIDSIFH